MTTQTEPTYSICEATDIYRTLSKDKDIEALRLLMGLLEEEKTLYKSLVINWQILLIKSTILKFNL